MVDGANPPVGLTRDAGYQIGVRRTFPISHVDAWELVTSPQGIKSWLDTQMDVNLDPGTPPYRLKDGTTGDVRVFKPYSHLRITWRPQGWARSSTMQIRVIPKGSKSVIAFHQEHLPGPEEREGRRLFFRGVLDQLAQMIQST